MNIACFVIAILLLFFYWFLCFDIYLQGRKAKNADGLIVKSAKTNDGTIFDIEIQTEHGKKTGRTPVYHDIIPYHAGYVIPVRYVSFNVGKKEVTAVRINEPNAYKNESYACFLCFAVIFIIIGIIL